MGEGGRGCSIALVSNHQFHALRRKAAQRVGERIAVGVGVDCFGNQDDRAGGEAQKPGFFDVGVAGGDAGGGADVVGETVAFEGACDRIELGEAGGEIWKLAIGEPGGGARERHAIGERNRFEPHDLGAGFEAEGFGDLGAGVIDAVAQGVGDDGVRLALEAFAESGALADGVAEAANTSYESAAALFGDDDAFFGQHREGAANRVAVGGKAFGKKGFGGEAIAIGEFAADDIEADGIGDLTPEGDAAGS